MPLQDAIDELRRCGGTQFDAKVVGVLVRVLRAEAVDRVQTAAPALAGAG